MDDNNEKLDLKVLFNICNTEDDINNSETIEKMVGSKISKGTLQNHFNIDHIELTFENWLITELVIKKNILEEGNTNLVPDENSSSITLLNSARFYNNIIQIEDLKSCVRSFKLIEQNIRYNLTQHIKTSKYDMDKAEKYMDSLNKEIEKSTQEKIETVSNGVMMTSVTILGVFVAVAMVFLVVLISLQML